MLARFLSATVICLGLVAGFSSTGCSEPQNEVIEQTTVSEEARENYEAQMNAPRDGI